MGKKISFSELKRLAEAQDASAQNELGLRYEQGDGVAQSNRKAASWYKKAAKQGFAEAQNNLAVCYEQEIGRAHV